MENVFETVLLGMISVIGLWLGNNYRRQLRMQLTEQVLRSYGKLWEISGLSPSDRSTLPTDEERRQLAAEFESWYYAGGNGMFLPARTRNLFFAVKRNLTATPETIRPPVLAEYLSGLPQAEAAGVASCSCNRQLSLLRSQLKQDLAFYTGGAHLKVLRPDEEELLQICGITTGRISRAVRWLLPASRPDFNPCVCGGCPGSPPRPAPRTPAPRPGGDGSPALLEKAHE
jgi:hypothetical protein